MWNLDTARGKITNKQPKFVWRQRGILDMARAHIAEPRNIAKKYKIYVDDDFWLMNVYCWHGFIKPQCYN